MTTQNTQQGGAPQMLDPDTAYAVVHQRVYGPVFFEKLANDYGLRPGTEAEAMEMLTMAAQLRMAHDREQEKQARAKNGGSLLSAASAHLSQQMAKMGFATQPDRNQQYVKEAAAQASFDPELAHAILSLQTAASGVTREQNAVNRQQP